MKSSAIIRSVLTLAAGTGVAQCIALAASPIVTRLYGPTDYALFAVFTTAVAAVLPFVCGSYELAIVVAGTERHSRELTALCLWISSTASLLLAITAALFREVINSWIGCPELNLWLLMVPLAVWLGGVATVCRYTANRQAHFALIARYSVIQAAASVALNICFGLVGWGGAGLLVANLMALTIGTVWLVSAMPRKAIGFHLVKSSSLRSVAHKYRHFPLYNASTTVLDALTLAMPVFFISRLFGAETVGSYGFLMRVALAPLALASGAVSQVHLKHVSDLVKSELDVTPYVYKIAAGLTLFALVPTFGLVLWAPELFVFMFGAKWLLAGEYLAVLIPGIAVQFVVSTVSSTCGATGNLRVAAAWKMSAFFVTLLMFLLVAPNLDAKQAMVAVTVTNLTLYVGYFFVILYAAKHPKLI